MAETVDEPVSVNLLSNHIKQSVMPWLLFWHGRRYRLTKVGLHYTTHDGDTLIHIFSATDGVSCFKLSLNAETLGWRLLEIETE